MKTDQIFYSIFKECPQIFFELIGETNIDITAYEFRALELIGTTLRVDGIMLRVPQNPKQPIYFIEMQFQKKEKTYSNLFAKVFLYLAINDPQQDWRAVVIYKQRGLEPTETSPYQPLLNSPKVIRVYLDEIETTTQEFIGREIVKFAVETEQYAVARAKQLVE